MKRLARWILRYELNAWADYSRSLEAQIQATSFHLGLDD